MLIIRSLKKILCTPENIDFLQYIKHFAVPLQFFKITGIIMDIFCVKYLTTFLSKLDTRAECRYVLPISRHKKGTNRLSNDGNI